MKTSILLASTCLYAVAVFSQKQFFDFQDYVGKKFPLPNLRTIDGKEIGLSQLLGKPTLINFWFTSCAPCIEEMPALNNIKNELGDKVNFVAITFESAAKAKKFLTKHAFDFTHIVNAKAFTDSLQMKAFPVNVFLDKMGIVYDIQMGVPLAPAENKEMKIGDGKEFLELLKKLL